MTTKTTPTTTPTQTTIRTTPRQTALLVWACALVCASSLAHAQQVSVREVTDKRTTGTFFPGMDIKLSVVGAGLADSKGLRRIKVDKATDDTGRNLVREERFSKTPFDAEVVSPKGDALDFELSLANPSRQAKTLQDVSGYVELHTPHKDPKSVVTLGPLSSLYGKKLPLPGALASKVGMIPVDKTLYDEMRKANASNANTNPGGGSGGELVQALRNMFSSSMDADALGFVVQGDTSDIVAVEVIDAQGKVIKHQGRFSSGSFVSLNFPGGVGTQSRLRVYLATPQSLVRIPFQLKGVALP